MVDKHIMYRFKDQIGAEPEQIYFRYYLRLALLPSGEGVEGEAVELIVPSPDEKA